MKNVILCAVSAGAARAQEDSIIRAMPPLRREKYEAARDAGVREQLLAAACALDGALRAALPGYEPPADFFYLPGGRPGVRGLHISIAHTGGMAVCAASDAPVGADIENAGRVMRPEMARRVLAPGEAAAGGRGLLGAWVDKEAYLKLTGEGLSGGMHRCRIEGDRVIGPDGGLAAYIERPQLEGYMISVCCREKFAVKMV